MQRARRYPAAILLILLTACGGKPTTASGLETPTRALTPALHGPIAELDAAMDRTASPCDDFYQYACGGWLATHPIPADKPFTSRVAVIDDHNHDILRALLEDAAKQPGDDGPRSIIGDFYAACMDEAAIDAAGITPLQPALAEIAAVKDLQGAYEVAARLRDHGVEAFMFAEMDADYREPSTNLLVLRQGGLGLPSRDLYLREDEPSRAMIAAYTRHIAAMLTLAGDRKQDVDASAREIVALETTLAGSSLPLERLRELEQIYHKMSVSTLSELTRLDWRRIFAAAGNPAIAQVNVATPAFFTATRERLAGVQVETLRAYLRWQLMRASAEHLSGSISAEGFRWAATLTGQRAMPPRWRRCVDWTVAALPEQVGPEFVARAFVGDSKQLALAMILGIEAAFEAGFELLGWMDADTRTRARGKVAAIRNKVGFPDRWRAHTAGAFDRSDYFGNRRAALRAEVSRQIRKADRPVDREEWSSPVSVLNAYCNPLGPEMGFPAAILQPPLFSTELPMAVNFGAIGAIMGHEIVHHFDDQGRKFNEKGALSDWWSRAAQDGFAAATRCVVQQYDAYEVQPGLHVNGRLTLGENIADLGGMKYAHAAYMQWAKLHPEPPAIPGLSAEQLFFVAYAQTYCGKETPELQRVRVLEDPHSPRRLRVIGPLVSSPAFATAFACPVGAPMRPAEVCKVW